jgi:hypothetical protein
MIALIGRPGGMQVNVSSGRLNTSGAAAPYRNSTSHASDARSVISASSSAYVQRAARGTTQLITLASASSSSRTVSVTPLPSRGA